ncbi:MAG: hypothetical protein AAB373_06640 [Patescibacteria group bacterium]
MRKIKAGRKTVMTTYVVGKLEEAFSLDCTDREACIYAGIHPDTLYEFQKKNPAFSERKHALKQTLILIARATLVKNLNDPRTAMWYLERKRKEEFSLKYIPTIQDNQHELSDSEAEIIMQLLKS